MRRRRFCGVLVAVLFTLFFSNNSYLHADNPVITGSAQMSAGGTQTLTVSGGSGPYTWSITGGGGSLSSSSGTSVIYTAPATNPNCTLNPKICVQDSTGQKDCIQIAVNNPYVTDVAFYRSIVSTDSSCCWVIKLHRFSCSGADLGKLKDCDGCDCNVPTTIYQECSCGLVRIGAEPGGLYCFEDNLVSRCNAAQRCGSANGVVINCKGDTDVRTDTMKAAGCCPAQLLPPPPQPPPPPACDLAISNFKASSGIVDRNGGAISFSVGITSSQSFTWTLTVDGAVVGSWPDSSNSASWNIKEKFAKLKDPKTIKATLLAVATGDRTCSASAETSFIIRAKDDDCTKLEINAESSINIASGNLSHAQTLFTIPNSRLMADFTLSYNSADGYNGVLAIGWTHTYNLNLKYDSAHDAYVLMTGNGGRISLYKNGSHYASDLAVYPTLMKNIDNTLTLTYKNGTIYKFNALGSLTGISDKNGNTVNLFYNANNNVAAIIDSTAKTIALGYDADNRISSITDPNNNHHYFTYSGNTLTQISSQNTLGTQIWTYTYDSYAFMLTKTDPQCNSFQYAYDADHRVSQTIDPQGQIRNIQYNPANKTTTVTEKDGGIWLYQYDSTLGALTARTDPPGNTVSYQYDSNRNLVAKTDVDGSSTSYTYDNYGNTTSVTDALGNTSTYTYNEQNLVTGITDATGKVTRYAYDNKGNLTATTDPAGAKTQYAYDTQGNITRINSPNGAVTAMVYDQYNNLISIIDPGGATTTQTYDNLGNMVSQTDALGNTTTFQYNSLNQLVAVTDSAGRTTRYAYDAKGNRLSTTDANGNATRYTYNYKDQLIQTIDALGNTTNFTYGNSGCASCGGGNDKLTAVTDAKGRITTYQYDQSGNLIRETDPLGNFTSYTYDTRGNMISKTKPDGRTIAYIYDALNRLLERKYPNNTADVFRYDQTGNVITATTNQNIAYYYSYDANNRVTGITDSHLRNIEYQYDIMGNRTMMATPEGKTIKYSYNGNNQLTKIATDKGNYTFTYDAAGRRIKRTLPNNTFTIYRYDELSRLTNITHQNAFHRIIESFDYTHDNVGNRLTKTADDKTINYAYDLIYRLTKASPQKKGKGQLEEAVLRHHPEAYSYDPVGNRQTGPTPNESYTYDAGNELLMSNGQKPISYEYDRNGNLARKTQTNHKGHNPTITIYAYDDENRLTDVKIQQGHKSREISFTYDPFGRRISKTVHQGHSPLFESAFDDDDRDDQKDNDKDRGKNSHHGKDYPITIYYLYDDQNIIAKYDQRGKLIASYVHGPNIDEPLSIEKYRDTFYYHADGLGSITALTNHMGNAVQRYEYDSFGNMKHNPHRRWITQPYTYTGREADYETGLYYYRARYYDPAAGRFITKDPIGFESGDYNLYAYAGGNPINRNDPSGLTWLGSNWCGPGGSGPTTGCYDSACKKHDDCYQKCGVDAKTRWYPRNISNGCAAKCDAALAEEWIKCACSSHGTNRSW